MKKTKILKKSGFIKIENVTIKHSDSIFLHIEKGYAKLGYNTLGISTKRMDTSIPLRDIHYIFSKNGMVKSRRIFSPYDKKLKILYPRF